MKKSILISILALCLMLTCFNFNMVSAEDKYVKVIYTTAYVFSSPEVNKENIIAEYEYGKELLVLESNIQGVDYLYNKIKLFGIENFSEGYMLVSQVIDVSTFAPKRELETNAKLSNETTVYDFVGGEYVETEIKLKSGTQIRLVSGYDDSVKYSKIQYLNEENEIVTAYIKTSDIEVSHISRALIGIIIIAITSVSIILILFGIKKSKNGGIKRIFKKNKH